ncbi:MAG: Smr/MutS family protein [Desulfuromonadales bacterium]
MSRHKKSESGLTCTPFKALKGVQFSEATKPSKKSPEAATEPVVAEEGADTEALFALEMARLGFDPSALDGAEDEDRQEEATFSAEQREAPLTEQDLFLQALGKMEVTFADEYPEEAAPEASPRRMKLLRKGKLRPEATLDLHGLTREEARSKVRFFLEDSLYHRRKVVLVITGRGKSSGREPILRDDMERYLEQEGRAWVSEWGRAPRQYGGEGALVIFLRTRD